MIEDCRRTKQSVIHEFVKISPINFNCRETKSKYVCFSSSSLSTSDADLNDYQFHHHEAEAARN